MTESGKILIYIPHWHPTRLNQLVGRHWGSTSGLRKGDRSMVRGYAIGLPKAFGRRRVELTIVLKKGQRGADPDAYWKSCLDAMKHAGLIINDNDQGVELVPVQYERGTATEWGTRIRLTDISPP